MPTFQAGWLVDDDGQAFVTDAAVMGPFYLHGAAFTEDGHRYVSLYGGSLAATDVHIAGIAHTAEGAMIYVDSLPSPAFMVAGWTVNEDGAVYLENDGTAVSYLAGKGLAADGALCVTGL